ncbi:YesL family protein [Schleiferilactobacillus harbinensis]|uniref:YesL family protein n=1 Tax=Schleiferilactobacillus harbinensis TaxID=304207 RepID=UPI0021A7D5A3|nr:DUF624 domain-containing protein [Schleiferilactobacillus harbinensis]
MHFNPNNPVWIFMGTLAKFTGLNVLFVLTCIPIITIGPARTALYATIFKYQENDSIPLSRTYWEKLKSEFRNSFFSTIIFFVLYAVLIFNLVFWLHLKSSASIFVMTLIVVLLVFVSLAFDYHFPILARFQNSYWQTWKNSFVLPWMRFISSCLLVVIDVAVTTLAYFMPFIRVLLLIFGLAWTAYLKSFIFLRVFTINRSQPFRRT